MKKILPGGDRLPKREPDVQTIMPFLDPRKTGEARKPQQVRDFERLRR